MLKKPTSLKEEESIPLQIGYGQSGKGRNPTDRIGDSDRCYNSLSVSF